MTILQLLVGLLTAFLLGSRCQGFLMGTSEMCQVVRQIDCIDHYQASGDETVCCSDDKTYVNKCYYVQAKCLHISLDIVHSGSCAKPPKMMGSTMPTIKVYNVSEEFCRDADKFVCPNTIDPLCGTDSLFYLNQCVYNKAKCKNPALQSQTLSNCKDAKRSQKRYNRWKRLNLQVRG